MKTSMVSCEKLQSRIRTIGGKHGISGFRAPQFALQMNAAFLICRCKDSLRKSIQNPVSPRDSTKQNRDPTLEYWPVGHDFFSSLLQGFKDGWSFSWSPQSTSPANSKIPLATISDEDFNNLSFLFGGVGDGEISGNCS